MSYLPNLRSRTARNSLASNYNATEEATASSRTLSKLVECFLSFGSHQSKEATEFKADLLEHYLQILSSQKESSVIPDEHSIVNNIHDHFSQDPNTAEKAFQFAHLYNKLSSTRQIGKKKSILYLLSLLNNLTLEPQEDSVSGSQSTISLQGSGLPNLEQDMDRLQLSQPYEIDMTDPPALQLAKVKSSYKRDVSESDILRDLVFIFQGIDGQYLKADESTQEYFFDTHFMHLSTANEQLTYQLTATGWLYRQVKQFIDKNQLNDGMGLVGQSLCAAVQEELTAYYKWIAILEAQVEKQTARGTMNDQSLTLKRLLVWMEDANNKLSLMRVLTEACEDQKGGALISTLHNYTRHGDPLFKGFVSHLLQVVSKPFYDMLHRWVYEGELDDPFEEFFVACDTTVSEEVLWQYKYSIRENMLPSFLSEELAQKIFSIGKSLNFIRYSCHDPMNTYTPSIQNAFKYGETQTVERTIDAIYLDTSRSLIDLLKTKYKLMDHLRALKRYLLLGQGDFIESLMDTLGTKLNQSASTLFRHNLTGVLETTIRSSNAQYEKPEILNRLDVRLLEIQKDDLGWDVFTLDYHVDAPINTVINPSAMAHYLQMFSFLWRLKRVEYTLSSSWKQWKMYRGAQFSEDLHQSQMTIQKMTHFIYQLQHYVLFEVLECSWKKLENAIESDCIDLDSIIESHNDYLNRITEKGFLSGVQETVLADRLNELFDCILDYKTTLDHLYGRSENEKLAETRRHHQEIETLFTSHVFEFLSILKSYHDEDLRSLSTRLDYNSFYFS